MVRVVAVAVLAVGAAGLAAADDAATKKAMKAMDGKYKPKALVKGGQPAPQEMIDEVEYILIKDGKITIKKQNDRHDEAKFSIDLDHKPAHMDITPTTGPKQDTKMKGIYKLEKGTLTIVLAREGNRPKDFKAEGEEEMKMVFERQKDE